MSKKFLLIVIVMVVALTAVGIATVASEDNNSISINQNIAGSIINGIELTTGPPANPVTVVRSLLNLDAKGAPGAARIEVVGGAIPLNELDQCPAGTNLELAFVDGGFVETFSDHSLLFYLLDPSPDANNALCITFGQPSVGIFDYVITGGVGRFEGATGNATVEITGYAVTPGFAMSGETGTIRGEVQLP